MGWCKSWWTVNDNIYFEIFTNTITTLTFTFYSVK